MGDVVSFLPTFTSHHLFLAPNLVWLVLKAQVNLYIPPLKLNLWPPCQQVSRLVNELPWLPQHYCVQNFRLIIIFRIHLDGKINPLPTSCKTVLFIVSHCIRIDQNSPVCVFMYTVSNTFSVWISTDDTSRSFMRTSRSSRLHQRYGSSFFIFLKNIVYSRKFRVLVATENLECLLL